MDNEVNKQEIIINPESLEGQESLDLKEKITKDTAKEEVEKLVSDLISEDEKVSQIEKSVSLSNEDEVEEIKKEINLNEEINKVNSEASILEKETENSIESVFGMDQELFEKIEGFVNAKERLNIATKEMDELERNKESMSAEEYLILRKSIKVKILDAKGDMYQNGDNFSDDDISKYNNIKSREIANIDDYLNKEKESDIKIDKLTDNLNLISDKIKSYGCTFKELAWLEYSEDDDKQKIKDEINTFIEELNIDPLIQEILEKNPEGLLKSIMLDKIKDIEVAEELYSSLIDEKYTNQTELVEVGLSKFKDENVRFGIISKLESKLSKDRRVALIKLPVMDILSAFEDNDFRYQHEGYNDIFIEKFSKKFNESIMEGDIDTALEIKRRLDELSQKNNPGFTFSEIRPDWLRYSNVPIERIDAFIKGQMPIDEIQKYINSTSYTIPFNLIPKEIPDEEKRGYQNRVFANNFNAEKFEYYLEKTGLPPEQAIKNGLIKTLSNRYPLVENVGVLMSFIEKYNVSPDIFKDEDLRHVLKGTTRIWFSYGEKYKSIELKEKYPNLGMAIDSCVLEVIREEIQYGSLNRAIRFFELFNVNIPPVEKKDFGEIIIKQYFKDGFEDNQNIIKIINEFDLLESLDNNIVDIIKKEIERNNLFKVVDAFEIFNINKSLINTQELGDAVIEKLFEKEYRNKDLFSKIIKTFEYKDSLNERVENIIKKEIESGSVNRSIIAVESFDVDGVLINKQELGNRISSLFFEKKSKDKDLFIKMINIFNLNGMLDDRVENVIKEEIEGGNLYVVMESMNSYDVDGVSIDKQKFSKDIIAKFFEKKYRDSNLLGFLINKFGLSGSLDEKVEQIISEDLESGDLYKTIDTISSFDIEGISINKRELGNLIITKFFENKYEDRVLFDKIVNKLDFDKEYFIKLIVEGENKIPNTKYAIYLDRLNNFTENIKENEGLEIKSNKVRRLRETLDVYENKDLLPIQIKEKLSVFEGNYGNKGKNLVILAIYAYGLDDPDRLVSKLEGFERILNKYNPDDIPTGMMVSMGIEYEVTASIANRYEEESFTNYKSDIELLSEIANIGRGNDAIHEIAQRPNYNPYMILAEIKLLQDAEFLDLNFEKYPFAPRGYHLSLAGDSGLNVDKNMYFLNNLLTMAQLTGITAGDMVSSTKSIHRKNIHVFTNKVQGGERCEMKGMGADSIEQFEKTIMTSHNAGIAIQAENKYLYLSEGEEFDLEIPKTPEDFEKMLVENNYLREPFASEKERDIMYFWMKLKDDISYAIKQHNESYIHTELQGYVINRNGDFEETLGDEDRNLNKNGLVRAGVTEEELLSQIQIKPSDLFSSQTPDFVNSLVKINNYNLFKSIIPADSNYILIKNAFGQEKRIINLSNINSVWRMKNEGKVVREADSVISHKQSIFENGGEIRDGYYYTQGGSEEMLIHKSQILLNRFNKKMEEILKQQEVKRVYQEAEVINS